MKIVIAGGSGFVGRELSQFFINKGYDVIILTRSTSYEEKSVRYVQWLSTDANPVEEIEGADVFINLAGVSLNKGRWTEAHQENIYNSRMTATRALIAMIKAMKHKPTVLINASAIGIYPASESAQYTEASTARANDFLGKTVRDWEKTAFIAEEDRLRVACMRFGVILGKDGGALPPIVMPYKMFVGGTVGSGKQWLSWIHIKDVIRAIDFTIKQTELSGPINVTAPFPKRMKYFGQAVGKTLHRPHWIPAPSFAMKLLLGKKSDLVLKGQYVTPEKLLAHQFEFLYPTLEEALQDLLK